MGAIADGIVQFAQPLLDRTDGSREQLDRAFALAQFCWNLAILPEGERDPALRELQSGLDMSDEDFQEMRRDLIVPMVERHEQMFPGLHRMHRMSSMQPTGAPLGEPRARATLAPRVEQRTRTPRNAPCPCGSGKKYKRCCGP